MNSANIDNTYLYDYKNHETVKNLGHCTPDQKSEDGHDGRSGRTNLHVDLGAKGKNKQNKTL